MNRSPKNSPNKRGNRQSPQSSQREQEQQRIQYQKNQYYHKGEQQRTLLERRKKRDQQQKQAEKQSKEPDQLPSQYQNLNFSKPIKNYKCQFCNQISNQTVILYQSGQTSNFWCLFCCLCCTTNCCLFCPYIFKGCLDKVHYCAKCGFKVIHKRQKCCEFLTGG